MIASTCDRSTRHPLTKCERRRPVSKRRQTARATSRAVPVVHGAQRGVTQQWKGNTYKVDLLPKVELKMIVGDALLEPVLAAIAESARTGAVGDGKVFVSTVDEVMRVRTGERGEGAV